MKCQGSAGEDETHSITSSWAIHRTIHGAHGSEMTGARTHAHPGPPEVHGAGGVAPVCVA